MGKLLNKCYLLRSEFIKIFWVIKNKRLLQFSREQILCPLIWHKPIKGFDNIKAYFDGKNGLEIGGRSTIFSPKSILPIYGIVKNLDNCNYSNATLWEGKIREGLTFNYHGNSFGRQFICEGTDLESIKSNSYDFVVSSHLLEHIANPLKALFEWKRVLKNRGALLLVIPHKEGGFDHNRPTTKLEHLIQDYENEIDEHDMSHLSQILCLHDFLMDPEARTRDDFVARSMDNFRNRCLHHHVFVTGEAIRMVDYVGLKIVFVKTSFPWHIIICGEKIVYTSDRQKIEIHKCNVRFLEKNAFWRLSSPFTIDKKYSKTDDNEQLTTASKNLMREKS